MSESLDVVVIGAGAAGLLAGARAAERGRSTLLLEKNRKLGVKILISGGTRCNLTHDTDQRGIAAGFPKYQGQFLRSALAALPPVELLRLIETQGVATKVESTGKVFPVSDRAIDVRDALVRLATESGCKIRRPVSVRAIEPAGKGFRLDCSDPARAAGEITAACVIVACGGQSYPGCGTTGDGYGWARTCGHTIVQPVPALTPIKTSTEWVRQLSGLTIPDALLRVVTGPLSATDSLPSSAVLDSDRGSLLFTHSGFSGPVGLNVSRTIAQSKERHQLTLVADFCPGQHIDPWPALAKECQSNGAKQIGNLLSDRFPRRLTMSLLSVAGVEAKKRCAELSKRDLATITNYCRQCPIPVDGIAGFAKAEVTAGGVQLDEVSSQTMESRLVPNLYFVGEVLDVDGRIGGYNFQAAFSTGWLAGSSV